ncbi:MAG: hypothetical protein H0V17_28525 [Deltaproteobacteria bacterium]|nr:hypothetical protein [Deltaproteobacteria bacterium]
MRVVLILLLLAGTARADDDVLWRTYAALRNDVFSKLRPPFDDSGFTHDNVASLRRTRDGITFGGGFMHRWITSRVDDRRWDQLELIAIAERAWPHLELSGRAGPTFGGNFGGRKMQNAWHELSGTGSTLDEGLQARYADDRSTGILAGGRARSAWMFAGRVLSFEGAGSVDTQLSVGAGVSSVEAAATGSAITRHVVLHVELAAAAIDVVDPQLALPGGYGEGLQLAWRAGIQFKWSRFAVGYQYRANEGGSGEPLGVVSFESRR